jgi:hypothetical protein
MESSLQVWPESEQLVTAHGNRGIAQSHEQVEAPLIYLASTERKRPQKPFAFTYGKPDPMVDDEHKVTIRNARLLTKGAFSLDGRGFDLIAFPTRMTNFYSNDEVRLVYYPEIERRLKEVTGATRVVISNHTTRGAAMAKHGKSQYPLKRVHNDLTVKSAPRRVRELLPEQEAERLLKNRFAAINVWRAIRGPVKDAPLALCDAESVDTRDLVANDLVFRERVCEIYRVTYNPSHRWYYFPDMQPDEAIFIKCYDSDESRARFTIHAAFDDPTAPPDAPPRESIEVRTFAFFE